MSTILDVANAARVSKATVSRVISGNTVVSPEVTSRVREAMDLLGYRPNRLAQGLANGRSNGVGLVVNELSGPFYGLLMTGVERGIEARGMHLMVASGHGDAEKERAAVEFLLDRRCDALVLHADALSDDDLVGLCRVDTPIFIINRLVETLRARSVHSDDEAGARIAVEHLIASGHRRIACITGPMEKHQSQSRLRGYRAALRQAGLPTHPGLVIESDFLESGGQAAGADLLSHDNGVTAVFVQSDQMALGVYSACRERGLSVPDDLSVVGFDDVDPARYVHPGLTTVRQPLAEMGEAAARLVLAAIDADGSAEPDAIPAFRPELIVRQSVRSIV